MITVFGGYNSGNLASVESVNPMKGDSHCPNINDLPVPRRGHIAQVVQGKMIVCGGITSGYEKSCLKYEAGTWANTNPMTQARGYASSIRLDDGKILITGGAGGSSSTTTAEIWSTNPAVEEVQTMALPEAMGFHCMARIGTHQLVLAGNGRGDRKMAYLVNITAWPFTFSARIPLSTKRYGAACGILKKYNGFMDVPVIVGGNDGSTNLMTTEVLINSRWEPGPTLPHGFSYGGYTSEQGFILVAGIDENNQERKDIIHYDDAKEKFVISPGNLQYKRSYTAATVTYSDKC